MREFVEVRSQQRGAGGVAIAMALATLLGMGALANDRTYVLADLSDLQNAADSGALAGASGLEISPEEARQRALAYAQRNPIVRGQPVVLEDRDVVLGQWIPRERRFIPGGVPADSVRVTARLDDAWKPSAPPLFFSAPTLEISGVSITASATATIQKNVDVILILDRSGDMPPGALTEIKETAVRFLDCLSDTKDQVGVGFFHSKPDPDLVRVLTPHFPSIRKALIPGPDPDPNPFGNKNIAKALDFARQELTSSRANPGAVRVAVLFSSGNTNRPESLEKAEREALKYAQYLKDAGIRLYTITIPLPNANRVLMERMASVTGGKNFDAPVNPDEVFNAIATAEDEKMTARLVE